MALLDAVRRLSGKKPNNSSPDLEAFLAARVEALERRLTIHHRACRVDGGLAGFEGEFMRIRRQLEALAGPKCPLAAHPMRGDT